MEVLVRVISCNVRHSPRDQKKGSRQPGYQLFPGTSEGGYTPELPIIPFKNLPLFKLLLQE